MKARVGNPKNEFNNNTKINLSKYLSKIISLKSIKIDSKSKIKKYDEFSEVKSKNQSELL